MDYTDVNNPERVLAPKRKTALWILLASLIASVVINAVFFIMVASLKAGTRNATESISSKQTELAALQPVSGELDGLKQQARSLHAVFNGQKQTDDILTTIESRLYKKSSIGTLQLNDRGEVTISGSVPSYEDYAKFYDSLTDAEGSLIFTTVKPTAVGKSEEGSSTITFTFTMILQPAILKETKPLTVSDLQGGAQ